MKHVQTIQDNIIQVKIRPSMTTTIQDNIRQHKEIEYNTRQGKTI